MTHFERQYTAKQYRILRKLLRNNEQEPPEVDNTLESIKYTVMWFGIVLLLCILAYMGGLR